VWYAIAEFDPGNTNLMEQLWFENSCLSQLKLLLQQAFILFTRVGENEIYKEADVSHVYFTTFTHIQHDLQSSSIVFEATALAESCFSE